MDTRLLIMMALTFAVGMGVAWVHTRRRIRAQMRDQMVMVAEQRIKQEILKRVSEQSAQELIRNASQQAEQPQDSKHESS